MEIDRNVTVGDLLDAAIKLHAQHKVSVVASLEVWVNDFYGVPKISPLGVRINVTSVACVHSEPSIADALRALDKLCGREMMLARAEALEKEAAALRDKSTAFVMPTEVTP